ncbi:MAG: hypothetical protein COW79_03140 [Bdellovibrionales bacterium CG22_combo_CG10-13_8_21_14_all_38_13]|nr:MAG: hypothetical protein COW79_03140 [Bdellovibrionales bacterium CG22_combo_CG10-13_8_21_14_all_38_13]
MIFYDVLIKPKHKDIFMKLKLLAGVALMAMISHAGAAERLVVKMKEAGNAPVVSSAKNIQHLFGQYYVVQTNDVAVTRAQLEASSEVLRVDINAKAGKRKLPQASQTEMLPKVFGKSVTGFNDPGLSRLWGFNSAERGGMAVNDAYETLGANKGEKVIVAVVDTGVDYNHEDLKDVMWTNEGEIAGNGIDDDNNGYIDDVHGINTLVRDANGVATGDPMDKHSHGTHVSGSIGAKQNNGIGVAGVASNVAIMAIRTVPNNGDETDVDVAESFLYAAKHGAKIINCSFGKSNNEGGDLVKDTINHIGAEYGVLVIAAAGNSSQDIDRRLTYPASFDSETLMVVAATTSSGGMASYSNYGLVGVDLAAPGSSIYSTTPGNRYGNMSGTSMASPNSVGVAAEVLSRHPELSPIQLKQVLMDNVTKVSRYETRMVTGGRINLLQTLQGL